MNKRKQTLLFRIKLWYVGYLSFVWLMLICNVIIYHVINLSCDDLPRDKLPSIIYPFVFIVHFYVIVEIWKLGFGVQSQDFETVHRRIFIPVVLPFISLLSVFTYISFIGNCLSFYCWFRHFLMFPVSEHVILVILLPWIEYYSVPEYISVYFWAGVVPKRTQ